MRRKALAVAGLALVLTLAACGKAPVSAPQLQTDPGANASASLFKDSSALVAAAKAGTEKSKSVDFDAKIDIGTLSMTTTGQAKFDGQNTAMAMTMDVLGQSMEMRLLSGSVYMKLPSAAMKQMGVTKPWAEFSLSDLGSLGQAMGSGDINKLAEQNDPSTTLAQIQKSGTIVSSDKTQLDGQPASHYVFDLDVAKMLDNLPAGVPAQAKTMLAGKNIHMPAELWLNNDQLPLQIKMDMTSMVQAMAPSAAAAKSIGSMKMTMKYTNWGSSVDIVAPPADQVQTGAKLPGTAGGAPTTKKHI
ncbi:MAG: hypothetical protein JWQ81_4965 [Amycolatopsis sp.]|jgi:hypothetical protein|uniref:hypothetical protein n=1 Tax=Amycolatopsis sp. TaxID=37632 RepID=UPI00263446C9|nr:hypothetical protein [Amycolatopsis sp.]MCU1684226.1 hypothetical protein [Amycolatopsis sp.]